MADEKKISNYPAKLNKILKALRSDQTKEDQEDPVLNPILADAKSIINNEPTKAVLLKSKHYTIDFWELRQQQFNKTLTELQELLLELPEDPELTHVRERAVSAITSIAAAIDSIEPLLSKLTMRASKLQSNIVSTPTNEKSAPGARTADSTEKLEKKKKNSDILPIEPETFSLWPADKQQLASVLDKKARLETLNDVIPVPDLNHLIIEYCDPAVITPELASVLDKKARLETLNDVIPVLDLNRLIIEYCDLAVITPDEVRAIINGDKDFSFRNFSPTDETGQHNPIDLTEIRKELGTKCFEGAKFVGAILNEITFSKFSLENIDFTNAILKGARLKKCPVKKCIFSNTVLSHARLQGSVWDKDNIVDGAIFDRILCNGETNLKAVNLEKIASMHFLRIENRYEYPAFKGNHYFADTEFLRLLEISLESSVKDDEIALRLLLEIMKHLNQMIFTIPLVNQITDALHKQDSKALHATAKELANLESQKTSTFHIAMKNVTNFLAYFQECTGVKASVLLDHYGQKCSQFQKPLEPYKKGEEPEWLYGLLLAVREDNSRAQYFLGHMYENGHSIKKNLTNAHTQYRLAHVKGDHYATLALGYCYQYGRGIKKDLETAFQYFQEAKDRGNIQAKVQLGECYFSGWGIKPDPVKAFKIFHKLVERDQAPEASAKFALGRCYELGKGVEQNLKKAIAYYQAAAEVGYAAAQYQLGKLYELGIGVDKDWHKALGLYQKAAISGNDDALLKLARCYECGDGVDQDLTAAFKFYQLLAEKGEPRWRFELGQCYANGIGVKRDLQLAFQFYQLAAKQGYSTAQSEVGYCYQYGIGVNRDFNEAFRFYQLAADRKNILGQYRLGECYEYGVGVGKDLKQAYKCYSLAAKQGSGIARLALGEFYEYDLVAKDLTKDLPKSFDEHIKTAIKHYRLAIMKQENWAQYALIQPPHNINNVAKDLTHAIELCRHAMAQGNSKAQAALGFCYAHGLGVTRDLRKAMQLFQFAADQYNGQAQYLLGNCYETGTGVAVDLKKAAENYRYALTGKKPEKSLFASSVVWRPPPSSSASSSSSQSSTSLPSVSPPS